MSWWLGNLMLAGVAGIAVILSTLVVWWACMEDDEHGN